MNLICKIDYLTQNTILIKGKTYEVEIDQHYNYIVKTERSKMALVNKNSSFFYIWDWFYTIEEMRDIKLEEIGI